MLDIEALRRHLQARHRGRPVRCVQTHVSWVLLDGVHAWKIKKPVDLGFVDFRSLEQRRLACAEELRLNRRLAPALYLDIVPVRAGAAGPRLDGDGAVIDHALRMRQFADDALLGRRLDAGRLEGSCIDRLAARLGAFHQQAPRAAADRPFGTPQGIEQATARVLAGLAACGGDPRLAGLAGWCHAQAAALRAAFVARRAHGWVREGHGDLHLDNLVDLGDEVTAFDCIEFDPALRWIDVQSDIAFLTMDLQAHGRADLAWRFLDRWLERSGDFGGLAVHRYYAVYRALVRALVAALRRAEGLPAPQADYLRVAERIGSADDPRLLLTHGPSGSGKSFLAERLLERVGAVRLRSDVERKRLFGLRAADPTTSLGERAYAAQATRRTYARLHAAAAVALRAGYPVIVDAAALEAEERARFERLADRLGVPMCLLDCRASPELLRARVQARRARGGDASEADAAVLERQLASMRPLLARERARAIVVDTGASPSIEAIAARWLAAR